MVKIASLPFHPYRLKKKKFVAWRKEGKTNSHYFPSEGVGEEWKEGTRTGDSIFLNRDVIY